MEELITPPSTNTQLNNKTLLTPANLILHTFYTYSSRYIPMPQKQKPNDSTTDPVLTINEPLYKQAKQRIQSQYDQLNQYINNLQNKFLQLNRNQLDCLSDKHRYYLRKFKKYLCQHKKLSQTYKNLQTIVIQSQLVQQQIKSIDFIKMISQQTQKKLMILKQAVQYACGQKISKVRQISELKQQLNRQKSQYFEKKRQQLLIMRQIQVRQKNKKQLIVQQTMRKIRMNKKNKQIKQKQYNMNNMNNNVQSDNNNSYIDINNNKSDIMLQSNKNKNKNIDNEKQLNNNYFKTQYSAQRFINNKYPNKDYNNTKPNDKHYQTLTSKFNHHNATQNIYNITHNHITYNNHNTHNNIITYNKFNNLDQTLNQYQNINTINSNYIKTLSKTSQNFKSKLLQDKKKINTKQVSQTDLQNFRIKSRQQGRFIRKSQQQQLLQNQQIIKQLTLTNRMKQQFHTKSPQELLNILIQNKKLKDLLTIIEDVKSQQIKSNILQKRKLNLLRSQTYKNNTPITLIQSLQIDPIELPSRPSLIR